MKAVILAGGQGTRLSEETTVRPKPMVEIGGKPILWHIMKLYSAHGINEFVVCLGYKSYMIKEYFSNYFLHVADVKFDIPKNKMEVHQHDAEPWKITLIDTGLNTQTGGRLKRVSAYLGEEDFCFTYGDGVGNVDIKKSILFHREKGAKATLTAVRPPTRYGHITQENTQLLAKENLHTKKDGWVNGGFYVLSPSVIEYIDGDQTIWERGPMEKMAQEGELFAFFHEGFFQPMDTLRDKILLEDLWRSGRAPWKKWD